MRGQKATGHRGNLVRHPVDAGNLVEDTLELPETGEAMHCGFNLVPQTSVESVTAEDLTEVRVTDTVIGFRPIKGKQSTTAQQTLSQDDVAADVSPVDKSPLLGDCDVRHGEALHRPKLNIL